MSAVVQAVREVPPELADETRGEEAAPAPPLTLWQRLCLVIGHSLLGLLVTAALGSALAVSYTKHVSRELFAELQAQQRTRAQLNVEYGRLRLEQTTWATPGRIERIARSRLDMGAPPADTVMVIRQ